jgi:PAS domain S-box-containing protein
MTISIKQRIYWSFALLVCLFVLNGIVTVHTINNNKKLSVHLSGVIEPSLQAMKDLEDMLVASKMYTTNWVFLRFSQEDKKLLKRLHDSGYAAIKTKLNSLSSQWKNKNNVDSLNSVLAGFEKLLAIEKSIMSSLKEFRDYDDPVIKLEAERKVEEEILPRTTALINSLQAIHKVGAGIRTKENAELERSSMRLRVFIIILAVTIILAGFLLSMYMTRLIIRPIKKIRQIINNMGQGITQKIDSYRNGNEIGEMIHSVNNLSEKLQATATFAHEVGLRNFDMPFTPLSDEDTLGKALIAMRDNIKSSDEKINEAQHIAHLGSLEKDMATGTMILSDEMLNILDVERATFQSTFQSIVDLVHPDDLERFKNIRNKYLRDHQPVAYECRIITTKGITKTLFIHSKVILDTQGKISRIVGILQDITERKRGEEKLAEERELFRLVIENIPDQIYLKDTESRFILCNMPVVINAGRTSQAEMTGKTDLDFLPEETAKQCFIDEQHIFQTGIPLINHEEHMPDMVTGKSRWSLTTKLPLRNNTGDIIGLIGINHDITEQKIAERDLQAVNRELSILFNSIDEIFFSVDMSLLNVIQISATCEKVYGYKQAEFLANYKLWLEIVHPDDKHIIEKEDEIMRRGEIVNNQYRIIRKDKIIRWVETKITPTLDEKGNLVRVDGVTRDITKRKLDEDLLHQSEISLAVKNKELEGKNKELQQFAYVASHDLQEPLRTTSSFVELLQQQYKGKLDERADQYLRFITQSSDRMKILIKDLLDYSRIGRKQEWEQVDCNIMLQDVLSDLGTAIDETGAEIKTGRLPVVRGYPTEIKQLFQNLIINAIKFRKKNTTPQIKISAENTRGYWQFAFADNGIGIQEKHNERIFVIFQRLHNRSEYEGSGIGLSHCKKIVELHHGRIWVESALGKGSTFYFTIPVSPEPASVGKSGQAGIQENRLYEI